jgi:hypothetical protein
MIHEYQMDVRNVADTTSEPMLMNGSDEVEAEQKEESESDHSQRVSSFVLISIAPWQLTLCVCVTATQ